MNDPKSFRSMEINGPVIILAQKITNEFDVNQDSHITITTSSNKVQEDDTEAPIQADTISNINQNPQVETLFDHAARVIVPSIEDDARDINLTLMRIVAKEQKNLSLLHRVNDAMKSTMSKIRNSSLLPAFQKPEVIDAKTNTINPNNSVVESTSEDHEGLGALTLGKEVLDFENQEVTPHEDTVTTKSCQKLMGKVSNNLRRRRLFTRMNHVNNNHFNVQTFIQDYYRSLDSVSRYIIAASIFSFFTAFLLLSGYSALIHSHDMEFFKMKEQRIIADQEAIDTYKVKQENFRENIIHQKYEESREYRSVLQSCFSKRDDLLAQISKLNDEHGKAQKKMEAEIETQRKEIRDLKERLQDLQDINMDLREKLGQTFNSFWAKIIALLNDCINRPEKYVLAAMILIPVIGTALIKK